MLSVFLLIVTIIAVFSDTRNFYPQDPLVLHNKHRIWMHLSSDNACYSNENDVRIFKDYLLSQYQCIGFDEQRRKIIYKHPVTTDYSVWSLWFESNNNLNNMAPFECLNRSINLPSHTASFCIIAVIFEPLQTLHEYRNAVQDIDSFEVNLWSLDILDGRYDNKYIYPSFIDNNDNNKVEAIILDTDIDINHNEFIESNPLNLFTETIDKNCEVHHGTHIAATVVGKNVGGAKNTKLVYFPVCQLWSQYEDGNWDTLCAWSDIEDGYETVIRYMNEGDDDKRYVINYSVGGKRNGFNEAAYRMWGRQINEANGIWVVSAGNNNYDACNKATAYTLEAITVGAYSVSLEPAWWSNYGECVDVWAPGVSVWSASPNGGYQQMSGTSMASPNIASMIVNLLKMDDEMDIDDIKEYLKINARNIKDDDKGMINEAYLALNDESMNENHDNDIGSSDDSNDDDDDEKEDIDLVPTTYNDHTNGNEAENNVNDTIKHKNGYDEVQQHETKQSNHLIVIICIISSIIAILCLLSGFGGYYFYRKRHKKGYRVHKQSAVSMEQQVNIEEDGEYDDEVTDLEQDRTVNVDIVDPIY